MARKKSAKSRRKRLKPVPAPTGRRSLIVPSKRFNLRLPNTDAEWWNKEVNRVAHAEGLTQASVTMLMHRIRIAELDLTQTGIAGYKRQPHIAQLPQQVELSEVP